MPDRCAGCLVAEAVGAYGEWLLVCVGGTCPALALVLFLGRGCGKGQHPLAVAHLNQSPWSLSIAMGSG